MFCMFSGVFSHLVSIRHRLFLGTMCRNTWILMAMSLNDYVCLMCNGTRSSLHRLNIECSQFKMISFSWTTDTDLILCSKTSLIIWSHLNLHMNGNFLECKRKMRTRLMFVTTLAVNRKVN